MAPSDLDATWTSTSVSRSFRVCTDVTSSRDETHVLDALTSSMRYECSIPRPPPFPSIKKSPGVNHHKKRSDCCSVPKEIQGSWDRLFKEARGADVYILTEGKSYIPAHSSFLGTASPVLASLLQQSRVKNGIRHIKILGVPSGAVYTFIQFLYSSCYEEEEMQKFVLHLLVLSHAFSVPCLRGLCVQILEESWLTKENVIDVLQLARNCDAPRLCFVCVRMVIKEFKSISSTEGWRVMKRSNPALEQELVGSVIEADSRKQERLRKIEERRVYLLLYEAMEALLHICGDGCSTIGPLDGVLKGSQITCTFPACKGLESLLRHFSTCKTRIPGGCGNCKRMWQLLELHSRICDEPDSCKVPLCWNFKEKMRVQTKRDEAKWKLLVSRVVAAKNSLGPFSAPHMDQCRTSQV